MNKELILQRTGILEDRGFADALLTTSVSQEDALQRASTYFDVIKNYSDMAETMDELRTFSGYTETPLLGLDQLDATLVSYVRAFPGYLSIERSMDQPSTLLWYDDVLGVTDNRIVTPNVGKDNLNGIYSKFSTKSSLVASQQEYSISTNKKLIPGSVEIKIQVTSAKEIVTISDDRKGNLIALPNFLSKGSVNYATGVITFTLVDTPDATGVYSVIGSEDTAGDPSFGQLTGPGNNRFKLNHKNILVHSTPQMLIGETNLMTIASAKKSIGLDLRELMGKKLTELYVKLINQIQVEAIMNSYTGDSYTIDMKSYQDKFTDYNSRLDAFKSETVNIDTNLAKKTFKATQATCYLVGENVSNLFRKCSNVGLFVDNTDSTYVNDLVGTFSGRPVLRHLNIPPNVGYAIHKTPGGELAPLIRGIHLPLTSTPVASNYNNTSQIANGVYYQEANEPIIPELVQKFEING